MSEEEELGGPNVTLTVVVGTCAVFMIAASIALMSYSIISSPKLGDARHLLVYLIAIGLTGILQALYLGYLVIGELVGFLATNAITGCFIIAAVEKYLESLPFMLLAALTAELGGSLSRCMRRSRCRRAFLVLLQILLTILLLNIAVFVNTRLQRLPDTSTGGESFFICVNTIPTRQMLLALRVSALGVGYALPFLILVFLLFARLFSPQFPVKYAGIVLTGIVALRWLSWLPVHLHAVLIELGVVGRLLNTRTLVKLHQYGSMGISIAGVLEMLLLCILVALVVRYQETVQRLQKARRICQETPV